MNKRKFGIIGEKISQGYLINKGYKILETNYYTRNGEIVTEFVGIKTQWFDKNNVLREGVFSTKDLKIYKNGTK